MRNIILAVLLVAGCTEAENVSADAPPIGTGHRDAAGADGGDAGGDAGPACPAPQSSLNGAAMYVSRSAVASNPNLAAPSPYGDCGGYIDSFSSMITPTWTVKDGNVMEGADPRATIIQSAVPGVGACTYLLLASDLSSLPRGSLPNGGMASPCYFSFTVQLVVP